MIETQGCREEKMRGEKRGKSCRRRLNDLRVNSREGRRQRRGGRGKCFPRLFDFQQLIREKAEAEEKG
jgi:hypothetical protein